MAEDNHVKSNVPAVQKDGGWLSDLLANFNLPTIVAGPAGSAVSRLIGGAVEIPGAWLEQKAQVIKDRTKARTELNNAVTEQAIKEVQSDPDLRRRAAESLIAREFRTQINKEAVAAKTIEILANSTQQEPSRGPDQRDPAEPAADWMNAFERYAADATSDRLRETWAKILADQIQRPDTFSVKTLRIVSELDPELARQFEMAAQHVLNDKFIPKFEKSVIPLEVATQLEESGLITGTGILSSSMTFEGNSALTYDNSHAIVLVIDPGKKINLTVWPLTKSGKEVLRVTARNAPEAAARLFAERFSNDGNIQRVAFGPIVAQYDGNQIRIEPTTVLWNRGVG
jgi:hypothetical protein